MHNTLKGLNSPPGLPSDLARSSAKGGEAA